MPSISWWLPVRRRLPLQLLVFGLLFLMLATVGTAAARWPAPLARALPRLRLRVIGRASAGVLTALAAVTLTARRAGG